MQQLAPAQANAEVVFNENFDTLRYSAVYGRRYPAPAGLSWLFYGGRWSGFSISDGSLTLANSATTRVVVDRTTGALTGSTADTNWDNPSAFARVYRLTTAGGVVSAVEDHRAGPFGVHGAVPSVRAVNSQSAAYTLTGLDAFTTLLHPSADTTARTFTIPANSAVAFRPGTELVFVNQNAAGVLTIAITTDTMRLAGAGTTGSRTLAANGHAVARKVTATQWIITGAGLT